MTICLTLSHCGLLIRRIKSDLLTAIIKWSQLAPIKPHGSRASIQSSAKFSASFAHHSLPWFIFLKPIKYVSYQVELNFLVYTRSGHSASADFAVTLKCHTGFLKSCSLAVALLMKNPKQPTTHLRFTYSCWNWPIYLLKIIHILKHKSITFHLAYSQWSFSGFSICI